MKLRRDESHVQAEDLLLSCSNLAHRMLNRRNRLCLVLLVAAVAMSAAAQKIKVGYDKSVDFSKYKTYTLAEPETPPSRPMLYTTVITSIDAEMNSKGFQRVEKNGDLTLKIAGGIGFGILVTGGPPRIVLTNVTDNQILAKSDAFPQSTNGWQQMNVEFTAPPKSEAVVIGLSRDNCSSSPCPTFGVVWLDDFRLQKL